MGAMGDQRCANNTVGHDLLQKTIAGIVATHETDLNQTLAASDFGIEDALAGGRSGSQRFFAEHWLVGCDRRQNVFFVGRTDGGHDDGIHTLCCDDVLPSALGPAAKVLGNLLGSCRIDIGHCHHTRPGQRVGDTADMILSNVSGSDNSDIDRHFW
jgi:hypothetical protein